MVLDDGAPPSRWRSALTADTLEVVTGCGTGSRSSTWSTASATAIACRRGQAPPLAVGVVAGRTLGVVLLEVPGTGRGAAQHRPGGRRRLGERVRSTVLPYVDSPELVRPAARPLRRRRRGAERRQPASSCQARRTGGTRTCPTTSAEAGSWPACSPNGKWIVATATPNVPESPPGRGIHALWLLSTDGADRSRLTGAGNAAYEAVSVVGRWPLHPGAFGGVSSRTPPGALLPSFVSTRPPARPPRAPGPVARIGPAPGENGHADWSNTSDWYRPQ